MCRIKFDKLDQEITNYQRNTEKKFNTFRGKYPWSIDLQKMVQQYVTSTF